MSCNDQENISPIYQKSAELLHQVQQITGPEVQQLLHSAESAMGYYPKVGYQLCHNAFVVKRER